MMHNTANFSSRQETLRTTDSLIDAGLVPPQKRKALLEVAHHYATAVPPAFQKLITHPNDPIARQVIPDEKENSQQPHENIDPIGDEAFSPVPGVVHRYEDRALLKPLLICPLYCRFCFRREHVGPDGGLLSDQELETAFRWFEEHPKISEVILTGGDPLMLSPRRIKHIIQRLSDIPHIETIRLHTRVPVAAPHRITPDLLDALETDCSLWIVLHANHARELGDEARVTIRSILSRAIPVLSQSVLLRGVNDTVQSLEELLRAFIKARVKPYYLHHLDPAPGTAHFHVPVDEGQALLRQLRGRVTGIAWPTYVLDIPGGKGKVPIGPTYLEPLNETQSLHRQVKAPDGHMHSFK